MTSLGAALALGACTDGLGDTVAGIEGTGATSGFGSVFVNGVEFATDDAEFIFNGQPASEADLRVGDIVSVTGSVNGNGQGTAERIVFNRVLDGPIESLDIRNGSGRLTALGQVVLVDPSTRFINTSASDLALNDLIAVSGLLDDNGVLHATSLEKNTAPYVPNQTRIDAEGGISNFNAALLRFDIGDLTVDFSNAEMANNVAARLQNGIFVEVFGLQNGTNAPLMADTVNVPERSVGTDGGQVQVDALITDFTGLDNFQLNGQPVDASNATRTDNSTMSPANGVRVEVAGEVQNGTVIASTLAVRPPADIGFSAVVDSVAGNGFSIFAIDAQVQSTTLYLDSAQNIRTFRIGNLQAGDTVTALGFVDVNNQFVVTRLERVNASNIARAHGPLASVNRSARTLNISGVTVTTNSATQFEDADGNSIDADSFFAEAQAGDAVAASGTQNANQISPAATVHQLD